ncbi:MAG TPA: TonB-dependent receptor [Xanthomonadales bacterium]|nr:TonB-dependent receptor [Xanthomonadales bacterium]
MKIHSFAIAALLASPALALLPASAAVPEQPEVVVTASRTAQTVDDALASVTVLTRADIERSQAPDLLELLRLQPGIDLSRTGGAGQSTTLLLRGGNSNHALVLVDGVRVVNTAQGLYDFAHLPLEQIERIEIVRGPRASWWGSDALSGVIQIFTRDPDGAAARLRAGSDGRIGGAASYGARAGDARFGVTLGGEALEGFSAQNPRGFSYDPDDDGYHNRNASLRGETVLGTQRVSAVALSTDADVEFDQGITDAIDRSGALAIEGDLAPAWRHAATFGVSWGEIETLAFGARFESRRRTLDWQHELGLGAHGTLALGLNLVEERGRSIDLFADAALYDERRDNRALYAGWRRDAGAFSFELAGRYDDNSAFGGEGTYQAAAGYDFGERVRAFASLGEGFRAPNLNELYFPGFGGAFAGNPELDPERSRATELGLDYTASPAHRWQARAFRSRLRDLIAFEGENFAAINVARARIDGVELGYAWDGAPWRLDANYTWQDARNTGSGEPLLRRPRHKLAAVLGRRHASGIEWAVEASHAAERSDFGGIRLPGYTLVNARVAWPFSPGWRLEARLDNALDRDYELAYGYETPGRSWLLALAHERR